MLPQMRQRRLLQIVSRWRKGKAPRRRQGVCRHVHILAGIAVKTFFRYLPLGGGRHFASQPVRIKRADDGIRDPELVHIVPNGEHRPRSIRERTATVGAWRFPMHHENVAVLQRQARTLTNNSPRPGSGRSSSINSRLSKLPGALSLTGLINVPILAEHDYLRLCSGVRSAATTGSQAGGELQPWRHVEDAHQQVHEGHPAQG